MWTKIINCGKQLTLHSIVREIQDGLIKVYDIIEVEYDQYKLELMTRDNKTVEGKHRNILNSQQLLRYQFEVQVKE